MHLSLNKIIYLPSTILSVIRSIKRQRKFISENLTVILDEAKKANDGSLSEADFKKITDYYGMGVSAVLGEAFCLLRGYKMRNEERMGLSCLGALTGLGDDFFDRKGLSDDTIWELINNPDLNKGKDSNEKLFLRFYLQALKLASDPTLLKESLFSVYKTQTETRKQVGEGISKTEITDITLSKGGYSVLFYRNMIKPIIDEREKEMLFSMGGMMQLGNDIFDVYKDEQAGIKTLVTTETNIDDLRKFILQLIHEWVLLIGKTNYPAINKRKFVDFLSLGISRVFVCLDMLEDNQRLTDNVFSPEKYSRKQMICDMEKPINLYRSLIYYIKLNGKLK